MGVVHHHQRVVSLRQLADFIQSGHSAVHGEDAVGGDESGAMGLRLLKNILQLTRITVGVAEPLCLAQPDAVNDRGVIQLIGDDRIFRAEECFEQAAIGVETGGVENGIVCLKELRYLLLQLLVDRLCAADEADGTETEAPSGYTFPRRLD